jgi:hypothetical protein
VIQPYKNGLKKKFKELLVSIQKLSMPEQQNYLKEHNIILNPIQLQCAFINNNIIFPDTTPSDNSDLVIELIFDILGKKYTVNLNLSEVILSDIQKLEYKVMELTEALNKLTVIVNKNYEDIIYAVEHGDLCNIEEDNDKKYILKLKK